MLLVATDAGLSGLLASSASIDRMWPQAGDDVRMLVHLLRVSHPSLAGALSTGLLALVAWNASDPEITLAAGQAAVRGVAQDDSGKPIPGPRERADEVLQLHVLDVVAEGRSIRKVAG